MGIFSTAGLAAGSIALGTGSLSGYCGRVPWWWWGGHSCCYHLPKGTLRDHLRTFRCANLEGKRKHGTKGFGRKWQYVQYMLAVLRFKRSEKCSPCNYWNPLKQKQISWALRRARPQWRFLASLGRSSYPCRGHVFILCCAGEGTATDLCRWRSSAFAPANGWSGQCGLQVGRTQSRHMSFCQGHCTLGEGTRRTRTLLGLGP